MAKPIKLDEIINSPLTKDRSEISSKDFATIFQGNPASKTIASGHPAMVPDIIDIPDLPQPVGLKFHIEINSSDSNGNSMHIRADADNTDDIEAIHAKYHEFMPRKKKFLGLF